MKRKLIVIISVLMFILPACTSETNSIKATETSFPVIDGTDLDGVSITNDIFEEFDVTIVNFWNNGCGTCIEEMPELEELYQELKELNVNMIGVGADSGESEEKLAFAKKVIKEKGVTYQNISPNVESDFYLEFIESLTGYPTTYVVDGSGNIIGKAIIGNVKNQEDKLMNRIHYILDQLEDNQQ